MYNVVFVADKGKPISVMNVYYAEPPFSLSVLWAIPPFVLMAIGELMFGMMGCEFFVDQTPQKLKYHMMMDWYWALAWSNLVIILVVSTGLFITYFFQVYWLSMIVLVAFVTFFYCSLGYEYVMVLPAPPAEVNPRVVEVPVEAEQPAQDGAGEEGSKNPYGAA